MPRKLHFPYPRFIRASSLPYSSLTTSPLPQFHPCFTSASSLLIVRQKRSLPLSQFHLCFTCAHLYLSSEKTRLSLIPVSPLLHPCFTSASPFPVVSKHASLNVSLRLARRSLTQAPLQANVSDTLKTETLKLSHFTSLSFPSLLPHSFLPTLLPSLPFHNRSLAVLHPKTFRDAALPSPASVTWLWGKFRDLSEVVDRARQQCLYLNDQWQ